VLLASSAPFVPDVARPIPASRGQIPSPPERSFEMGRYSSPPARRRSTQPMAVAEASDAAPYGPGRAMPGTPIAGYATAVLSGRGLY
jgi:hypothetical protein